MLEYDGPEEVKSQMSSTQKDLRFFWNEIKRYRVYGGMLLFDRHFVPNGSGMMRIGGSWWRDSGGRPKKNVRP